MATLTKHVLGTPTGKIGDSVCFSTWKGKACIRSIASSYKDANTDAQIAVRAKFSLIGQTLVPLSDIIAIGWRAFEKTGRKACTAQNAYVKYHLKDVPEADLFNGTYPEFTSINPDKLILSRGALTGPDSATYALGRINMVFPDDADTSQVAYAVLYNPTTNQARYGAVQVAPGTVTVELSKGDAWTGDTYLYYFVTNEQGTKASTSDVQTI